MPRMTVRALPLTGVSENWFATMLGVAPLALETLSVTLRLVAAEEKLLLSADDLGAHPARGNLSHGQEFPPLVTSAAVVCKHFRKVPTNIARLIGALLLFIVINLFCASCARQGQSDNLVVDLRTKSDNSKYFISTAAYPRGPDSNFGHAFMVFGEENSSIGQSTFKAYGLYSWPPTDLMGKITLLALGSVPGGIFDEHDIAGLLRQTPAYDKISDYITLIVDKEVYDAARHFLPSWATDGGREYNGPDFPERYKLFDNDCVAFVKERMDYLGLRSPERSYFSNSSVWLPQAYVKWMVSNAVHQGTSVSPIGTYKGEMFGDRPNGEGEWTYFDGSTYKGRTAGGYRQGQGTLTLPGGRSESGTFEQGWLVKGTFKTDAFSFEGDWLEHYPWIGRMTSADGSIFQGEFRLGPRDYNSEDRSLSLYQGEYHFPDGTVFNGYFK
jgi:hypothetical protein